MPLYFCPVISVFYLSIFFPYLISAVGYLPYFHTRCGLCVNLECTSDMCCTRLARNVEPKNDTKNRHLGTIAQLWWAISSQQRHVLTIGKNLLNTSSTCPDNMVKFGPLTAEIVSGVWGTPAHFNGFRVLAALLHGILVVGVSQTLRR